MTNNKQQTAVDLFAEKTFNLIELMKRKWVNQEEFLDGMIKARNEAKEMEKEQSKSIFQCGRQFQLTGEGTFKEVWEETYGGGEQ
jgi:hypothetical protein